MEAEGDISCLNLDRNSIGILKDGPPIQRSAFHCWLYLCTSLIRTPLGF